MLRLFLQRTLITVLYGVLLLVLGTLGYVILEGASPNDALWMTVITVTAVGYDEVVELSAAGRIFSTILLVLGITGMGLWFALLTSSIVELDLQETLKKRRMSKTLASLSDHIVVAGAGRTGRRVITELLAGRHPFVVIDRNADHLRILREDHPELLAVEGDATQDHTLEAAGIRRARGLIASLSADTDNVYVCLSARALNSDLQIVARAYEDESAEKLLRAGADHVVSPNVSGALQMAGFMLRPSVVSFLDVVMRSPDTFLRMEQATIASASPLAGRTLVEARIRQETGLMVIAIRKAGADGHGYIFNPAAETRLEAGDEIIVLGTPEQVEGLRAYART
ncbi:MAG: potassium channel protein [Gemmatimonadetes bacterium]|nr:potassium channel protein [Gemmatimonadota bacterium]